MFNTEQFHNPNEIEVDLKREINDSEVNRRIAEVVRSNGINVTVKEVKRLIGDRNLQIGKAKRPDLFPGPNLTETALAEYERELKMLKNILGTKEDQELISGGNPIISRIKNKLLK